MDEIIKYIEALTEAIVNLEDEVKEAKKHRDEALDRLLPLLVTDSVTTDTLTISKYVDVKIGKKVTLSPEFYDQINRLAKDRVLDFVEAMGALPGVELVNKLKITRRRNVD